MPEVEEKKKSVKKTSEQDGSIRPGNGNILVLLVGINKYRRINDLGGCIADLDRIEAFLKKRYHIGQITEKKLSFMDRLRKLLGQVSEEVESENEGGIITYNIPLKDYNALKICRLENENATYENIIQKFRNFLGTAGSTDRVWFHFSGHGSEAPTAEEFLNLEDGKDQCLMCHDFDQNPREKTFKNALADKELAALLHEIANGPNGCPHIVLTMDCCHSGGLTRDSEDFKVRQAEVAKEVSNRSLDSYLNGYYKEQMQKSGLEKPEVPVSPHIVLTACSNLEKAGERRGGFFTNGLIDSLESVGGEISYADLQVRTRFVVKRLKANQTPQFNVIGGTTAYSRFLEGTNEGDPDRYEIKNISGAWAISVGAIHGLPSNAAIQKVGTTGKETINLKIFAFGTQMNDAPVASARLLEVGPMYSTIELTDGQLEETNTYFGVLDIFPAPPEFILLDGKSQEVDAFEEKWLDFPKMKAKNIHYLKGNESERPHNFVVEMKEDNYQIKNVSEGRPVDKDYSQLLSGTDLQEEILRDLIKITNWQRLLKLKNANLESELKDKVTFALDVKGRDNKIALEWPDDQEGEIHAELTLKAREDNSMELDGRPGGRYFDLFPKIEIKGTTEKLYCYLFKLHGYGIIIHEAEKPIGKKEEDKTVEYERIRWGLNADEERDIYYFKLIVSSTELDYHQLLQAKIKDQDRGDEIPILEKSFEDWYAATIKLDLTRE